MSVGLTNRSVVSTPLLRVTSASKKITFSFDQYAVNLIVGWNELISWINYFSDSSPSSQIKNISSIYLHQTFGLTLFKIFSSKASIKSIAYGGANFVPFREFVCKFNQKIQKCYSSIQVQQVLSKCLF